MMAIRHRELEKLEWKKKKMLLHRILGGKVMMIMVIVMTTMTITMVMMIAISVLDPDGNEDETNDECGDSESDDDA